MSRALGNRVLVIVGGRTAVRAGARGLDDDGNGVVYDDARTRYDNRMRFVAGSPGELGLVAGVGVTQQVQQVGEVIVAQPEHARAAQRLAEARAGGGDGAVVADVGGHTGAPLAQQQSVHEFGPQNLQPRKPRHYAPAAMLPPATVQLAAEPTPTGTPAA